MKVGDLIGVDGSAGYNHGCRDYAILRYEGGGKATVIEAQNCTSCWQVGHDSDHVFATIGDTWDVPETLAPAGDSWATTVAWEM